MRYRFLLLMSMLALTLITVSLPPALAQEQKKQQPDDIQKIAVGNPDVTFLDQLSTNGIPAAIGEMMGNEADALGSAFTKAAKDGTLNSGLIAQKHFAEKIANINQALGRMLAVMDVGGKVYSGNYEDAAWSAGLTVLTELAGTETGKGALAYVGCSTTAPVTAAVLAVQVYRESAKQVAQTKGAVQLESLYGTLEIMLRARGRKMGEGDPFPVTGENIDKVWQKVLNSQSFRATFRQYVVDQLNKPFPEPGYFESFYAADTVEKTAQEKLKKNEEELKSYIAGLISTLNKAAKADEQRVLAVKAVRELQRFFQSNGADMEQGVKNLNAALKRIPEAEEYANICGPRVAEHIKDKSTGSLSADRAMIVMYVRDVIRWIPSKGPFAEQRNRIYAKLKSAYAASLQGTTELNAEFEKLAKEPKVPEGDFNANPRSYYEEYFQKEIKPFDWDGSGGPESAKSLLRSYLEAGNFRGPRDPAELPKGRKPLADVLVEAWNKQNYYVACSGGDYTPGAVPEPEKEKTIDGYAEKTSEKLNEILSKALNSSPIGDNAKNREAFRAAHQMALQALSSQASLARTEHEEAALWMSAAVQQYRDYSLQLWQKASNVHSDLAAFGCSTLGPAFGGAVPDGESFKSRAARADYALAPEGNDDPFEFTFVVDSRSPATWTTNGNKSYGGKRVSLDEAASLLSEAYSQSGIGSMSEQTGSQLSTSLRNYFNDQAGRFADVASEIRRNYGVVQQYVDGYCGQLESNADFWGQVVSGVQSDLAEIRKYVDPDFLQTPSFNYFNARRSSTPSWAASRRAKAAQLAQRAEQYASEWESDAFQMRRLGRLFNTWFQTGTDLGILGQSGGSDTVGKLTLGDLRTDGTDGVHYSAKPYPHYITASQKAGYISRMREQWQSSGLEKFTADKAPWLKAIVDGYFEQLNQIRTFGEDNFLPATSGGILMSPVTAAKLSAAEAILNKMQPGTKSFEDNFSALLSAVPMQISYPGDREREQFRDLSPECLQAPLAPRYTALRNSFKEKLESHRAQEGQMAEAENKKQLSDARAKLPGMLNTLRTRINEAESLIKKSLELKNASDIQAAITKLNDCRTKLTDDPYPTAQSLRSVLYYNTAGKDGKSSDSLAQQAGTVINDIGKTSSKLAEAVGKLTSRRDNPQEAGEEIKKFYEQFKQAYEYKNDAKVLSFIDDDWSAGDGTGILDLEDYLRNSFTVFDQIKYAISNLKATKTGQNRYKVSYDVTITGRIYDNNITHEEKSSVVEEVTVDSSGRMKISKTLDGKFWYVR